MQAPETGVGSAQREGVDGKGVGEKTKESGSKKLSAQPTTHHGDDGVRSSLCKVTGGPQTSARIPPCRRLHRDTVQGRSPPSAGQRPAGKCPPESGSSAPYLCSGGEAALKKSFASTRPGGHQPPAQAGPSTRQQTWHRFKIRQRGSNPGSATYWLHDLRQLIQRGRASVFSSFDGGNILYLTKWLGRVKKTNI